MKPRYVSIAIAALVSFTLLSFTGINSKGRAQEKSVAAVAEKKPVTIDFKPGDAAQLALLRIQLNEVNKQIGAIFEQYHCEGCTIRTDERGNWIGLSSSETKSPKP